MNLSIIIVNFNTKDLLKKCLKSIFNYSKNIDYELIIIDNASKDRSQEFLSKIKNLYRGYRKSKIKIILNEKNLGFAKAVNQGIKLSEGEYILLLNPDTEIKENTLEKMLKFMENKPNVGICGGKILNLDGTIQPSVRKFPDLISQIFVLLKLHHFFKDLKPIKKYFYLDFDYSKTQEVDQVMGAFFMIKRELVREIGLFDENFFLWFEEVDFCYRAKKAGWQIYYFPESEVIHQKGASFSQVPSLKNQWQFNKSLLYYFKKHHHLSYLIILFFIPINLFLSFFISFLPFLKKFKKI